MLTTTTITTAEYAAFAAHCSNMHAFVAPWWLDAFCETGITWLALGVRNEDHLLVAVLPFFVKQWHFGFSYVTMPTLMRYMGPVVHQHIEDDEALVAACYTALLRKLPFFLKFTQEMSPKVQQMAPFAAAGFSIETKQTYLIKDIQNLQNVWQNISPNYRNNKIAKAQKTLEVKPITQLDDFLAVHNKSFERQGLPAPVSQVRLQAIHEAALKHQSCTILAAVHRTDGQMHSVAYLLHDQHTAYYLMSGDDYQLRSSGSGILLIWEAIRYASEVLGVIQFDFCGSMIPAVARVRKDFGAEAVSYHKVSRTQVTRLFQ